MRNHDNLVCREEEREMIPLRVDRGVGVIRWSPLARGLLAGTVSGGPSGAPFGQAMTRSHHVSRGTAPDGTTQG